MVKNFILTTALLAGSASLLQAQTASVPCGTDAVAAEYRRRHPQEVAASEAQWQQIIDASLRQMNLNQFAKVTQDGNNLTKTYHIPVVFHVIHEYGSEDFSDNLIFEALDHINTLYDKRNADTTDIIPIYKGTINGTASRYVGRTKFVFHLASKDPYGNPTNGITRRRHYLTLKGGDYGKLDGWSPDSYVNIWFNRHITTVGAAAYATPPSSVDNASGRITDGVMVGWAATTETGQQPLDRDNTIGHELGHVFSLAHPWGNTNNPGIACGDDGVDDTPPTQGHGAGSPALPRAQTGCGAVNAYNIYDTSCIYTPANIGKLVLDSPRRVAVYTINDGPTFIVHTSTWLDSVFFYAVPTAKTPYIVELSQNGTVLKSVSDSTTAGGGRQRVRLNMNLAPGTGYKLSFLINPGAFQDSVKNSFTAAVPGALQITSDTALNRRYRYFYNWSLRYGYFRFYDSAAYRALYYDTTTTSVFTAPNARYFPGSGFLVDYPDTTNSQNVMDYTYCSKMFTNGQATRMRLAAASPIAGRNNLSTDANLMLTGVMDASGKIYDKRPDAPPVADFSLDRYSNNAAQLNPERLYVQSGVINSSEIVYRCTDEVFTFTNRSYGDTVSSINWSFSNGANASSTSANVVKVSFSQPGWATVALTANSNAGTDTEVRMPIYVADKANTIAPVGYLQDFKPNSDRDKWPIFNYYNNSFKWQVLENVGLYDNSCISYRGFDMRNPPPGAVGTLVNLPGSTPEGDYDDFFSPAFNLTDLKNGNCNINFSYAGASRSSVTNEIRDTLGVYASTDCGTTWQTVGILSKRDLNNNGFEPGYFVPTALSNWKQSSMDLRDIVNNASDASHVLFRFRYRPGAQPAPAGTESFWPRFGTSNYFYMDRIYVSSFPLGVDEASLADRGLSLVPNPTNGASTVVLKDVRGAVTVTVTDITGKVVFQTERASGGKFTQIEVPAAAVQVKGLYLVQVVSEGKKQTEKLVVY